MNNDLFSEIDVDVNHYRELYPHLFENSNDQCYTIDRFNQKFADRSCDLSIFHANIRSLGKNGDDLAVFMSSLNHNFQIICLTETCVQDSEISFQLFDNYNVIHSMRNGRKGGEAALLIKKNILNMK